MAEEVVITGPVVRGMQANDRRMGSGTVGQGQRRVERDAATDGEARLPSGRRGGR